MNLQNNYRQGNETILTKRKGKLLMITINRPNKGNSLDPLTLVSLRSVFLDAQQNNKINAILLTASGERDFCTGIDINVAKNLSTKGKVNLANVAGDIATMIFRGKPTIVAVNGRLMGMGGVFTAAADYKIVVKHATFRMPEITFGAFPGASCIPIFTKSLGIARTRRILMFAETFDANMMKELNLADIVVEKDKLYDIAIKIAKKMSREMPILIQLIKKATFEATEKNYKELTKLESRLADYYLWTDEKDLNKKIREYFGYTDIKTQLTGDPEELIKEYNNIYKLNQNHNFHIQNK